MYFNLKSMIIVIRIIHDSYIKLFYCIKIFRTKQWFFKVIKLKGKKKTYFLNYIFYHKLCQIQKRIKLFGKMIFTFYKNCIENLFFN